MCVRCACVCVCLDRCRYVTVIVTITITITITVTVTLLEQDLARSHIFKGVWTTGVPWSGGSCHGTFVNCSYVSGATQEYDQDFQDPLFGSRADYPDFVVNNLAGSSIPVVESWDYGNRADVGGIISVFAQAFQAAYKSRPIENPAVFINSEDEYEYYRSYLASWEGETIFGNPNPIPGLNPNPTLTLTLTLNPNPNP
jgi:hypothetical protein